MINRLPMPNISLMSAKDGAAAISLLAYWDALKTWFTGCNLVSHGLSRTQYLVADKRRRGLRLPHIDCMRA